MFERLFEAFGVSWRLTVVPDRRLCAGRKTTTYAIVYCILHCMELYSKLV